MLGRLSRGFSALLPPSPPRTECWPLLYGEEHLQQIRATVGPVTRLAPGGTVAEHPPNVTLVPSSGHSRNGGYHFEITHGSIIHTQPLKPIVGPWIDVGANGVITT